MHRRLAPTRPGPARLAPSRSTPSRSVLAVVALASLAVSACGSDDLVSGDDRDRDVTTTTTTPPSDPPTDPPSDPTEAEGTDGEVEPGTEVEGDGYHGWILDPDADDGWLSEDGAEMVWLTEDEVERTEAVLAEQLPDRRDAEANPYAREQLDEVVSTLDEYERQYLGATVAVDDGEARRVYVNALCTTDLGGDPDAISTTPALVMDGGSCFWQATVDLTSGELVDVSVNGDA